MSLKLRTLQQTLLSLPVCSRAKTVPPGCLGLRISRKCPQLAAEAAVNSTTNGTASPTLQPPPVGISSRAASPQPSYYVISEMTPDPLRHFLCELANAFSPQTRGENSTRTSSKEGGCQGPTRLPSRVSHTWLFIFELTVCSQRLLFKATIGWAPVTA